MRRFRSLYRAYRELRYRFEEGEEVGGSGQEGGKAVLHKDRMLHSQSAARAAAVVAHYMPWRPPWDSSNCR